MADSVDREALKARAWLLERHKVPRAWSLMVAEVWLRLDVEDDGGYAHTDAEISRVAVEMGKEKLAIVRAVAFLTVAARSGLKVGLAVKANREVGETAAQKPGGEQEQLRVTGG